MWYAELGHLESDVSAAGGNLPSDLDGLPPDRCQRPVFYLLNRDRDPHEVSQTLGMGLKLKPDLVVAEIAP